MKWGVIAAAVALAATPGTAMAGAVVSGFSGQQALVRSDDTATGALNLGFTANYFGQSFTQTYISNNGYVTFGGGQTAYTPQGLGSTYTGRPIIAAFFADVDTRNAASGVTSYGTGTFAGRTAFGVTWPGVGYYNSQGNKLNTFQLLLVDRSDVAAGDFDIYFNYDSIQWETGSADGGVNGLGGRPASAGYNAGAGSPAGSYYEFAGSRTAGGFLDTNAATGLARNSNVGVTGRYLFNVRSGAVTPGAVPEPATWGMMILGFAAIGASMRRRKSVVRTSVRFA